MLEPSRVPLISFTDSFNACRQKLIETLYHDFFLWVLDRFCGHVLEVFGTVAHTCNSAAFLSPSATRFTLILKSNQILKYWYDTFTKNRKKTDDALRMRVNENRFSHWKRWRYPVGITDNSMTHTCSMSADKLVIRARSRGLWTQSPTPSEGPTEPTLYLFT